jgi:hypothetical protein
MTKIYESPDGGNTVYARDFGKTARTIIEEGKLTKSLRDLVREDQLWHQIRLAAETNVTLHKALERAKMLYRLIEADTK